jgi:hypothetical protein
MASQDLESFWGGLDSLKPGVQLWFESHGNSQEERKSTFASKGSTDAADAPRSTDTRREVARVVSQHDSWVIFPVAAWGGFHLHLGAKMSVLASPLGSTKSAIGYNKTVERCIEQSDLDRLQPRST